MRFSTELPHEGIIPFAFVSVKFFIYPLDVHYFLDKLTHELYIYTKKGGDKVKVMWNRNLWTGGKEFIFFDDEWGRMGSIIAETEFLSHLTFEWVSPMDFYRNVVMAGKYGGVIQDAKA